MTRTLIYVLAFITVFILGYVVGVLRVSYIVCNDPIASHSHICG